MTMMDIGTAFSLLMGGWFLLSALHSIEVGTAVFFSSKASWLEYLWKTRDGVGFGVCWVADGSYCKLQDQQANALASKGCDVVKSWNAVTAPSRARIV